MSNNFTTDTPLPTAPDDRAGYVRNRTVYRSGNEVAASRWGPPPAPSEPFWVRALTGAVRLSVEAASVPLRAACPIVMSRAMAPARTAANFVVGSVSDAMASVVAEQLVHNTEAFALIESILHRMLKQLANDPLVAQLIVAQADAYMAYLTTNTDRVNALVDNVATDFIGSLEQRPELLDAVVQAVAGRYIEALAAQPDGVQPLVEAVAANYIHTLGKNPELLDDLVKEAANRFMLKARQDPTEVNKLVQVVGDKYMDYLNEHPDDVQQLLAGQTASMTIEVVEEIRETSVGADNLLENRVRSLFRLKPRSSLPAGPSSVAK